MSVNSVSQLFIPTAATQCVQDALQHTFLTMAIIFEIIFIFLGLLSFFIAFPNDEEVCKVDGAKQDATIRKACRG